MNDFDIIKSKVSIPFALDHYGHSPVEETGNRLHYHNPTRQDAHPSLHVRYEEDKGWKWNDSGVDKGGDIFDLLEMLGIADTMAEGWSLVSAAAGSSFVAPEIISKKNFDVDTAAVRCTSTLAEVRQAWEDRFFGLWQMPELSDQYKPGLDFDTVVSTVYNEWEVATDSGSLIAPYYDAEGVLTSYKILPEKMNAAGGSHSLYGLWRLDDRPIVLVEGETDAWAAQAALGTDWLVLGVPGATARPQSIGDPIAGRDLVLAFDGDQAGRACMDHWLGWSADNGAMAHVVTLAQGRDVCDYTPEEFLAAFAERRAQSVVPSAGQIAVNMGTYGKFVERNQESVWVRFCNWHLEVERVLTSDDGNTFYEGVLLPHGHRTVLPSSSLLSNNGLVNWANSHGCSWEAGGQAHQHLAALLQSSELGLPRGKAVDTLGLHDGTFVWQDNKVGPADLTYVAPLQQVDLDIALPDVPIDRVATIETLLSIYDHDVITPMLAWCTAAFVRGQFAKFPYLMIHGVRGTGKTETTEYILRTMFGGWMEGIVGDSTAYGLKASASGTNLWPLWLDEFRRSSSRNNSDARAEFEQVLRGAYNGKSWQKGGQDRGNVNKLKSFHYTTPLIVSGEDMINDPANAHRYIFLRFTREAMANLGDGGLPSEVPALGRDLMTWFASDATGADLRGGLISPSPAAISGLERRQRENVALLQTGWAWLQEYVGDQDPGYSLPPLDLSQFIRNLEEVNKGDDLAGAISTMLDDVNNDAVFSFEGEIAIRSQAFLDAAERMAGVDLTVTKVNALGHMFKELYGAERKRIRLDGNQVWAWCFDPQHVIN